MDLRHQQTKESSPPLDKPLNLSLVSSCVSGDPRPPLQGHRKIRWDEYRYQAHLDVGAQTVCKLSICVWSPGRPQPG